MALRAPAVVVLFVARDWFLENVWPDARVGAAIERAAAC